MIRSPMDDVMDEFRAAVARYPAMNSAHEGFAVLKEEVDDLWEEVRAKQGQRSVIKMRREAIQVAAMALRFVNDICDQGKAQV